MKSTAYTRRRFLGATASGVALATAGVTDAAAVSSENLLAPALQNIDAAGLCRPWSPRQELQPHCRVLKGVEPALVVESNGSAGCHGGWELECRTARPGATYEISLTARLLSIPRPVENVSPEIYFYGGKANPLDWEFLDVAHREGNVYEFHKRVVVPDGADRAVVRLLLRWTAHGAVEFNNLVLKSSAPVQRPRYRVAVGAGFKQQQQVGLNVETCIKVAEEAARGGAQLVALPETITSWKVPGDYWQNARPIPGEETDALAACAVQHNISIALSALESNGGMVHNTGLVFGSDGSILLKYRKLQPAVGERWAGLTPGDDLPVVKTPLGCVGMQICYDNTHPETIRTLACRGAEIVVMPIMGDPRSAVPGNSFDIGIWRMIMRMRALDNHVWFVVSRNEGPGSCIVNPAGEIIAEMPDREHLIYGDVDLNFRNWSWSGSDFHDRYWRERRPTAYSPLTSSEFRMSS